MGRIPYFENCYYCGKYMLQSERNCYTERKEEHKGYCRNCYRELFSQSCRLGLNGTIQCKRCKKFKDIQAFGIDKNDIVYGGRKKVCKECIEKNKKVIDGKMRYFFKVGSMPDWPNCYKCGDSMSVEMRSLFSYRDYKLKGYCQACYWKYFFVGVQPKYKKGDVVKCGRCGKRTAWAELTNLKKESGDNRKRYLCNKCDIARQRKFAKKNPDKLKKYVAAHKPKRKIYMKKLCKNEVDTLDDAYIRRLLARYSDLTENEFPQEVVEIKRAEIKLYRALNPKKGKQFAGSLTNKGE